MMRLYGNICTPLNRIGMQRSLGDVWGRFYSAMTASVVSDANVDLVAVAALELGLDSFICRRTYQPMVLKKLSNMIRFEFSEERIELLSL